MESIVEFLDRWLRTGTCENNTGRNIKICIGGRPSILPPGATTPESQDCDGVVHDDDSATKIWGRSGIREHKEPAWVRENWPECVRVRPSEAPDPPSSRNIISVDQQTLQKQPLPLANDLAAGQRPLVALHFSTLASKLGLTLNVPGLTGLTSELGSTGSSTVFVSPELLEKIASRSTAG